MKKSVKLILFVLLSYTASAQISIDSTNVVQTCLDCDSINVSPLPNPYGSLYIEVSGGTSPYTFSLIGNHPANNNPSVITSSTGIANYTQLCQDTFQLTVTDFNNVSILYDFSTIPPTPPYFNIDSTSVKSDSTNFPDSGVIELFVTTDADSVFYKIEEQNNSIGNLGGWQASTIFDSLPGGYSYKIFVDIYPKVMPCAGGIDTASSVMLIYVPLACENGYAYIGIDPFTPCVGETVTFYGNNYPGNGVNNTIVHEYWDLGDSTYISDLSSFTHIYTQPGTYNINHMIFTSHGCAFFDFYPLSVNPKPSTNFNVTDNGNGNYLFTDLTSGTTVSWYWTFGDGYSDNTQNPTHQFTSQGTYTVCLTATNIFGCDSTYCSTVNYTTSGVNEQCDHEDFIIYPNPTKGIITVEFHSTQNSMLKMTDLSGKVVKQLQLTNTKEIIDLHDLSLGIYFLHINNEVRKIVIE